MTNLFLGMPMPYQVHLFIYRTPSSHDMFIVTPMAKWSAKVCTWLTKRPCRHSIYIVAHPAWSHMFGRVQARSFSLIILLIVPHLTRMYMLWPN